MFKDINTTELLFTDQLMLSVNSGVHTTLHPNCHHQIIHSSFDLNVYYLPPYQCLIWDYKKIDSIKIRKAPDLVNWERLFDRKDINAQVIALNETILNEFQKLFSKLFADDTSLFTIVKDKNVSANILNKDLSFF